jgi:hypothetical protein
MANGAITSFDTNPTSSTSYGENIVAAGSTHTKGSYVELYSSTAFAADGLYIHQGRTFTSGNRSFLFDIATGAAASESIFIADIGSQAGDDLSSSCFFFRVPHYPIASGTRLSARSQSTVASAGFPLRLYIFATDELSSTISTIVTNGANTGITTGTEVNPGAVANTKGSYAVLSASTSGACRGLTLRIGYKNTFPTFGSWRLDLATGAAASEVVLLGDLSFTTIDFSDGIVPRQMEFEVAIPASTRVTARSQSTITDAGDRHFQATILRWDGSANAPTGGQASFTFAA